MKTLADGSQVSSGSFYFLLDFNDKDNWNIISGLWGEKKLSELNIQQYIYLFKKACAVEIKSLSDVHQKKN